MISKRKVQELLSYGSGSASHKTTVRTPGRLWSSAECTGQEDPPPGWEDPLAGWEDPPSRMGGSPFQARRTPFQDRTTPLQAGRTPLQDGRTPFQDGRTPSQQGPFTAGFHRANNPGQSSWSYTVTQSWKSNTTTSGTFYSSAASQVVQPTLKGRGIRLYILKKED